MRPISNFDRSEARSTWNGWKPSRTGVIARHGTCRWLLKPVYDAERNASFGILSINNVAYAFASFEADGQRYFRLTKSDGTAYNLHRNPASGELQCDCPDATYRNGCRCKHRNAVVAALAATDAF